MKNIAIFFVVSSLFLVFGSANAQEVGLGVSKALFDVTLLPGTSYTDEITVTNRSKEFALPLTITLAPWDLREEADEIEFITAEPALNAALWFSLSTNNLILAPGERRPVSFTIATPAGVSPGTYLAAMRLVPALPASFFTEGGSRLIPEIVPLFFIRVGELSLDGERTPYGAELASLELVSRGEARSTLRDFVAPRARAGVFEDAIKRVVATFVNTGVYHFKAKGYIEVSNWYGREVTRKELPERYLIPNRARNVEIEILPELQVPETASFLSRALFVIRYSLFANSYAGRYRATLVLEYPEVTREEDTLYIGSLPSERRVLIEQAATFWVVPWKFWGPLALILTLASFGLARIKPRLAAAYRVLRGL